MISKRGRKSWALMPVVCLLATACLLLTARISQAVVLEFDTELTELNLTTPSPVPLPLASDPGNALGDSVEGYGWVDSLVTVTLSSQRLISPGPASLGQACATNEGGGPTGQACHPTGSPPPINPNELHGQNFHVDSFFDVWYDITVTDVDPRPGRDYAGMPNGASITLQDLTDSGIRDMQASYSAVFDKDHPNYNMVPPTSSFPYIGHFDIEIPLGGDINGNGENDKIKFTLAAHQVDGENATFIILPDGTVVDNMDSIASLDGLVVDESTDPPFHIDLAGPTQATSKLINQVVPEPSALVLLMAAGVLMPVVRRRRGRNG